MYYYNSQEFTTLLLAQPIKRSNVFLGQFLGVACSLSISLILGLGIPFMLYGLLQSTAIFNFLILLVIATFLTFIFSALAYNIALSNQNKIKGFGYAILLWLFMAVIYDGIILISLVLLQEYPLEGLSLTAMLINPIDLARTLIILKLDISALLGYTGAVFKSFFGTSQGFLLSLLLLVIWIILPVLRIYFISRKKDF
jgi:Cu-processing system permease protein